MHTSKLRPQQHQLQEGRMGKLTKNTTYQDCKNSTSVRVGSNHPDQRQGYQEGRDSQPCVPKTE